VRPIASRIITNTLVQAQKCNLDFIKTILPDGLVQDEYNLGFVPVWRSDAAPKCFLNDYYDDEGCWALAWIAAYDLTNDQQYLQIAESIFEDMTSGWCTPCGGVWWDKGHTYVNAIANLLFLSVAAHFANRSENKHYYLAWAQREWAWSQDSGMINPQGVINDGLDITTCKNNHGIIWSYNQGIILGGLAELSLGSSDLALLLFAQRIATAAIFSLVDDNGVLHDQCEPNCGADGSQFKGIFMRNLQKLYYLTPNHLFGLTLRRNADSIWRSDRNSENELSLIWSGPFISPANASTQSSALDALVAAAAVF
jgi:predicted alpha-1,6-mannanase (GH76 family)